VLNFVRKKLKVPSNVQKVLVPLQYTNHWSVIVNKCFPFYALQPFQDCQHFPIYKCAPFFAKMWAITQGKLLGTLGWKRTLSKNIWVWLDGPQQLFDYECGFYVMKFMTKYVNHMY
jgi:hypothetical protein